MLVATVIIEVKTNMKHRVNNIRVTRASNPEPCIVVVWLDEVLNKPVVRKYHIDEEDEAMQCAIDMFKSTEE